MTTQGAPWRNTKRAFPSLAADLEVDVLIVGGGITGVSAAWHLKSSKQRVALIEAGVIAGDVTSKGTGMLVPGLDMDVRDMIRLLGLKRAKQIWSEGERALRSIKTLVRREHIDCGLVQNGSLIIAEQPGEIRILQDEQRARARLGLRSTWYEGKRIVRVINAKAEAVLHSPYESNMNQVEFVRAMAKRCQPEVAMYEETPLVSWERVRGVYVVQTPRGVIRARHLIFATNLATEALLKSHKRNVITHHVSAFTTARLTAKQLAGLGWKKGHVLWTLGMTYVCARLTADHRLVIVGEDKTKKQSKAHQDQSAWSHMLFPGLGKVRIDHHWSGEVQTPPNSLPIIGRREQLYYSYGYSGHGVLTGWLSGERIAEAIVTDRAPILL